MNKTIVLTTAVWAALSLTGCVDSLTKPSTDISAQKVPPVEAVEEIVSTKPKGPKKELTADVVYDVLVGEIAGQRGDLQRSVSHLLRASEVAGDVGLTKRAARVALLAHDYSSALKAVDRWLLLEPGNQEAMRTASILYLRNGDAKRSAQQLNDIVSKSGDDTRAVFESVVAQLVREANKPAALEVATLLAQAHPQDRFALYSLGRIAFYAGDYPSASIAVEKALEYEPDWPKARSFLARVYVKTGNAERGVAALRSLLDEDPDNNGLRQGYARLLLEAKDYPEARVQFRKLVDANERDTDALYALGLLELDADNFTQADIYFKKLVKLNARINESSFYLGNIAEHREDWAAAASLYAQVLQGPFALDASIRKARMVAKYGHLDAAVSELRALGKQDPELATRLYIVEAELFRDVGRLEDALKSYDTALQEKPNDVDLLYARGLLAEQLGHMDWLERDLRRVIELEPDNAHALNALGYTLADRTTRYSEALQLVERALKLLPDDQAIVDSMGWVNYRLGNLGEAVRHLRRAMDIQPDAEIAAHLGEVLWVMGDKDAAALVWETGFKLEPDSPVLSETVKRLRK